MERKWTDYTTKTTPADNDEVLELSTDEKVQKRLTLGNLSDWILNKVADKVYSKLETNNKTLVTAINELNSKAFSPIKVFASGATESDVLSWAQKILEKDGYEIYPVFTKSITETTNASYSYSSGFLLHNDDTCSLFFINCFSSKIIVNSKARTREWGGWVTK